MPNDTDTIDEQDEALIATEGQPLLRTLDGQEMRFPPAQVTFKGVLPPGFDGPVAGHLQGIFRPVALQIEPGNYELVLNGQFVAAGAETTRRSVVNGSAMCIGSFVAVWLKNPTNDPQPFEVLLLGHNGDRDAPDGHELASCMNFGLAGARVIEKQREA